MRSGEIAMIDFGVPIGSAPALVRPAVVVTAQPTLAEFEQTFHVVPITNTPRRWPSDVTTGRGHAQCHLVGIADQSQVVERTSENVGPVTLAQIRETVSVLLGS
ncbi:MAG: type II toxin-antitoxin system PemK/MazF family toxin [Ilumatobacteraceae bacterium]|nr:type II toxin-antitoxin system PemK/MazF family toxin [Ilumatobacteraceae bacterium]